MNAAKRLQALNGIRVLLAMEIVLYHAGWMFDHPYDEVMSFFYGDVAYLCVLLFFFLSGMTMTIRYRQPVAAGELGFTAFLGKRLKKQYPIYLLSNLFMLAVMLYRFGWEYFSWGRFLRCLTLTSTGWWQAGELPYNDSTWFVCVLMLMYICFYAVQRLCAKTQIPAGLPALLFMLLGLAAVLAKREWPFFSFHGGLGMLGFFAGSVAALAAAKLPDGEGGALFRILSSRPLRFLGQLSMRVFYMQFPVYALLGGSIRRLPRPLVLPAYTAAVLLAALLLYMLFERGKKSIKLLTY